MRTIKFRAWNTKHQYMDNSFFICASNGCAFDVPSRGYDTPNTEIEPTDDLVVMQFTGLTDINGFEIYEGDIVSVDGSGACEVKICSYWGVVYVDSDGYDRQHADCVSEQDYPTIIGNIHQNPELLK